jgi:hypothetical protein
MGLAIVTCVSIKVAGAGDPKGSRIWRNEPLSCFSRQSSYFQKESVMEAVIEKKSEGEAVKVLGDTIGKGTVEFQIELKQNFGRAFISWKLSENYAIGPDDKVDLREGNSEVAKGNWPINSHVGTVDTGHDWGSGLNSAYWAMNYKGASHDGWKKMAFTPNT